MASDLSMQAVSSRVVAAVDIMKTLAGCHTLKAADRSHAVDWVQG
jgi:hypothetical protein